MTNFKHVKKGAGKSVAGIVALILVFTVVGIMAGSFAPKEAYADEAVLSAADIYEQNVNSTVGITTSTQTVNYWGYPASRSASGSGFIITDSGYILTNYHVIENSDEVKVATYDGKSYDASVIGYDESNDIAVLKIEAEGLKPVKVGDSDALRVGDDVLAIGNPLGELTFSLTSGIVSALSRDIMIENGISMSLIQTDCAINSGNSGGALFNMKGEVIGITNAKYSSSSSGASVDNIGFAIPMNTLVRIYESIIENGYILKPYIGIVGQTVSEDIKQITGLEGGVRVSEVTDDSPAKEAGIVSGDVIIKVNGDIVKEFSDLSNLVDASEPGDILKVTVYRQGQEIEMEVKIGSKVQSALNEDKDDAAVSDKDKSQQYYGNGGGNYYYGGGMEDFFNDFFRGFGYGY